MTRRDALTCMHEPFGDAFYFGPERLSERYEGDEKAREESGFSNSTYKTIFERIERETEEVGQSRDTLPPFSGTHCLITLITSLLCQHSRVQL